MSGGIEYIPRSTLPSTVVYYHTPRTFLGFPTLATSIRYIILISRATTSTGSVSSLTGT